MSKKNISILVIIISVLLSAYLIMKTVNLAKYKKTLSIGSDMAHAEFIDLEGKAFYTDSLKNEKIVFIFFSASCLHCQTELTDLNKRESLLNSIHFLLIGREKKEELASFIENYPKLKEKTRILSDPKEQFLKKFGSSVVPNAFIYKNRKLIKQFKAAFDLTLLDDI